MTRWALEERGETIMIRLTMSPPAVLVDALDKYGYTPWWTKRIFFGKGHRAEIERILTAWNTQCENRTVVEARRETLCWSCDKSGFGCESECCWERSFLPVEGWKAERHEKRLYKSDTGQTILSESFLVLECPLYKKMRRKKKRGDRHDLHPVPTPEAGI